MKTKEKSDMSKPLRGGPICSRPGRAAVRSYCFSTDPAATVRCGSAICRHCQKNIMFLPSISSVKRDIAMTALPEYSDDQMRKLAMPMMYIAGEDDATVHTAKSAERLSQFVPHAEIELLKNTGHVIYDMLGKILPFLEESGERL